MTTLPISDFYLVNPETGEESVKTTRDFFHGSRTVLFMVPGAFTPTCSARQLPEFEEYYDDLKSLGVSEVYCLSVNDAYVMTAWAEAKGITKVKMLPDGNGQFTAALNAAVAKSNKGMGSRAWRLAMIVNENGVVEWAGVEEGQRANASDDPYQKSSPREVMQALQQIALREALAEAADAQAEEDAAKEPVGVGVVED